MNLAAQAIVIDTNVALQLWHFNDIAVHAALTPVLACNTVYGTQAMLKELLRVARSPHLAKYSAQLDALAQLEKQWRHSVVCLDAVPSRSATLRCRDLDDQVFLDVALHVQAHTLYTRDHDLLKLKKRAAGLGLRIQAP